MSNKFKIVLLLVLSGLLITGCNDKKKRSAPIPQGTTVFFHNINGTGELQLKALNTNERNSYGTVDFQQFSNTVFLNVGSWGIEAVNDNSTLDTADNKVILSAGVFTVKADELSIVALSQNNANEIQLFNLSLADNSGNRSINVSNLDKSLPTGAKIYIVPDTVTNADDIDQIGDPSPYLLEVPTFGETSKTLQLPVTNNNESVYIYIRNADGAAIYTSGMRTLGSNRLQTLIISPNHYEGSTALTGLFYYRSGQSDFWPDLADLKGKVRVLNLYNRAINVEADFPEANGSPESLASSLSTTFLSSYKELNADQYRYSIKEKAALSAPAMGLYLLSTELWTVVFYGNNVAGGIEDLRSIKIKEEQNKVPGQSTVTITNAAYFDRSATPINFDVFIYKVGQNPENLTPSFESMQSPMHANKRYAASDLGTYYNVDVLKAGSNKQGWPQVYASGGIELVGGNNYHLVIHGIDGSGFSICEIKDKGNNPPQACENL